MRIICAWCEIEIGRKEPLPGTDVTWGICEACYARVDSEAGSMHRDTGSSPAPFPNTPTAGERPGLRK